MPASYRDYLLLSYVANIAGQARFNDPVVTELMNWVEDQSGVLRFEYGQDWGPQTDLFEDSPRRFRDRWSSARISEEDWTEFRKSVRARLESLREPRQDTTALRLGELARLTNLSETDIRILEVLLLYETEKGVESLIDDVFSGERFRGRHYSINKVLPPILGLPNSAIAPRFKADAPLVRSGLVGLSMEDGALSLASRLNRLARVPGDDLEIMTLLLGESDPAELEWSDFDHVAEDRDHIEQLLSGALRVGEAGVNVLVYGPPGTGKTQFCRTIAARLDARLFSVGENDDEGGEPTRQERLGDLMLTQNLLSSGRSSLVLFDEMVDLLPAQPSRKRFRMPGWRPPSGGSKLFMNRLLENAPVPTLWTANERDQIPEVLLRRMKFALELRVPPPRIRARIWERQLARNGIEATPDQVEGLARTFEAPPGVAAEVVSGARLTGGGVPAVRRGLQSLARVLSCDQPEWTADTPFDLSLLQADSDVVELADQICASGQRRFSLCLQGPPGTGKSACVRYLADRLGMEVMHVRASDLLNPYIGITEKLVARAFRQARDNMAFLVFDEADSLLGDRRNAVRNWEVSQTNEMLTWMESHPWPFACTTNFAEHLDVATLRRFTFKIALKFMTPEQAVAGFRHFFGLEAPPAVAGLTMLTPGDFAVVRKQAEVLGRLNEPDVLAGMLDAECRLKPDHRRPIGFQR